MLSFVLFILIACLLLVVSLVGVVLRIFFPWLLPSRRSFGQQGTSGRKKGAGLDDGFNPFFTRQQDSKKEGEVTIDYIPPRKDYKDAMPSTQVDPSEYVEYEEISHDDEGKNL